MSSYKKYIIKDLNVCKTKDLIDYKRLKENEFINLYINNMFSFNNYKNEDNVKINYNKFIEFLKNNYNINSLILFSKDLQSNFYILIDCLINSNISNLYFYNLIFDDFNDITMLFEILKFNTSLIKLDLINMNITNDNISSLYNGLINNKTLTYLNLTNNYINKEGLIILGKILEKNNTLNTLDLTNNKINDNEYFDKFCESLIKNKSLTELILCKNNMNMFNIKSLTKMLKYNQSLTDLNLENTNINDGIKYLEINNNLISLNISNNNIIYFENLINLLKQLEYNTSLTSFNISNNFILHNDDIFHTYRNENVRRIKDYVKLIKSLDYILINNIILINVLY